MTDTTHQELRQAIVDRVESVCNGLHYADKPLTPTANPGPTLDKLFSAEFVEDTNAERYRDDVRERLDGLVELVMFHRAHQTVDAQGYMDSQDERDKDIQATVAALVNTITPPLNTTTPRHRRTRRTVSASGEWLISYIYLTIQLDWSVVEG